MAATMTYRVKMTDPIPVTWEHPLDNTLAELEIAMRRNGYHCNASFNTSLRRMALRYGFEPPKVSYRLLHSWSWEGPRRNREMQRRSFEAMRERLRADSAARKARRELAGK